MKQEPIRDVIPQDCYTCKETAYFVTEDLEGNHILACQRCATKYSSVWCSNCGMGGDFIEEIEDRPSNWTCPVCKNYYELSPFLFDHPIPLYPESLLPSELRPLIPQPKQYHILEVLKPIEQWILKLERPFAFLLLGSSILVMLMHILSLITGKSYLFFPLLFFLLALIGISTFFDATEAVSTLADIKKAVKRVPPLWIISSLLLLIYGIVLAVLDWGINRGAALSELPPDERASAQLNSILCLQVFFILILFVGGLSLLQTSRNREN